MSKASKTTLVTLLSFGIYFLTDETWFKPLRSWINQFIHQVGVSHILSYILVGIPVFLGTLILHKRGKFFDGLGLNRSFLTGMLFALLCTLPMFAGFALLFEWNTAFSFNHFLITVIAAAFFEELYFRGFLFGQIYRFTSWGFIASVLIGAVIFGLIHLYQGTGPSELAGIFLLTFSGGILYAWVFAEWNYNLWIPVFLHLFMNLAWGIFSVAENALGGLYANIFRLITILLIIGLTIAYKVNKKLGFEITKKALFLKKQGADV